MTGQFADFWQHLDQTNWSDLGNDTKMGPIYLMVLPTDG